MTGSATAGGENRGSFFVCRKDVNDGRSFVRWFVDGGGENKRKPVKQQQSQQTKSFFVRGSRPNF